MTSISFEYFPPKTDEQRSNLRYVADRLSVFNPTHVSVTHGASGSNRSRTYDTVAHFHTRGFHTMAHLTCIGSSRQEIRAQLHEYIALGIRRIIALRGDQQKGAQKGDFAHAIDLVHFIRQETGNYFTVEVAAYPEKHPEAHSLLDDTMNFIAKVKAGADAATTQYFFNTDDYFRLVDNAERFGVTVPIIPGIMPITSLANLHRFSAFCGASIPRWLDDKLAPYIKDPVSTREAGADIVAELCDRLITGGAPALHFYTLNQHAPVRSVLCRLAVPHLISV